MPYLDNNFEELNNTNKNYGPELIKFKFNSIKDSYECENNKNELFEVFKKYGIKFYDDSFSTNESLIFYCSNIGQINIPLLNNENYTLYEKMKKNSLNGIYPNLKLLELKGDTCIQATSDIAKNTLLFEIGGEVMANFRLNKIYKIFENRYWCVIM